VTYPDGIGTVIALKRIGIKAIKIPGVELWLDFIKLNYNKSSFYFIGASEEVLNVTIDKLKLEFDQIEIKGFRNGYIQDEEIPDLINDVVITKPDVVMVAMGSPRQEMLMNDIFLQHEALYFGLGGSFDIFRIKKKSSKNICNPWFGMVL
jgi:UDP-N-acetyl-D-mannosaminouronate:lipid I N-acetyl-D-mannosaminouronosyltransferase